MGKGLMRAVFASATLCFALSVRAQEPPAPEPAAPRVEAPRLIAPGEVVLAEGVAAPEADVTVMLQIMVDVEGVVAEAEVLAPVSPEYDAAAIESARRARFEPARRDGVAMPARIRFSVVIPAPPPGDIEEAEAEPLVEAAPLAVEAPAEPVTPAPEESGIVATLESAAERHERSAEAVNVLDLADARRGAADLGEIVARAEGVSIRRSAGLGGQIRFTLNGLGDERIRFFLDGVPLEFAGFPMSFANMPVFVLQRVEIYRGVVPIRFGADALGGAVNLVTDERVDRVGAGLSYQVGSFGTHRLSGTVEARAERTGFFARGMGFLDSARNDYPVAVDVTDASGRLVPDVVRRFNDGYRAYGGSLELGISEHGRIRTLSLRAYATQYDKELQHNTIMTVPYGDVRYGEDVYGVTLRANVDLTERVLLSVAGGYARRRIDFWDQSLCIYDWYGTCVRMRATPGEIEAGGFDQTVWQDAGFARLVVEGRIGERLTLRGALAPTFVTRDGVDRTTGPMSLDPLNALRHMTNVVTSVEAVGNALEERLELIVFAKSYLSFARSTEVTAFNVERDLARDTVRFGAGASGRFLLNEDTFFKLSYEYATRVPTPDETFGNGVLILANLELAPEVSHNVNVGATVEREVPRVGTFRFESSLFGRFTEKLILLLGSDKTFSYQNVYAARSLGLEIMGRYAFPRDHGFVSANLTYQDFRNVSSNGTFGAFDGDRIPNQPVVIANFEARGKLHDLWDDDTLALGVTARYIPAYYRSWARFGTRESKQSIPTQMVISATLGYERRFGRYRASATLEARNLTNASVFDFFGVQRPGREYHLTVTLDL